jgi:hypothetical protein
MADGKTEDNEPDYVGTKDSTVVQKDGGFCGRDAGNIHDHKSKCRLVQLGKLVESHNPKVLSAAPRNTD